MHRSHRSLRFSCIQICILRIRKCISCVCQYRLIAFCARHSASTKNATNLRADVSETDPTTKPAACVKWATSTSTPKSDADACRRRRRCRCRCWRCCTHFALNSTSKRNLFSPIHKHKLTLAHTQLLTLSHSTHSHTHSLAYSRTLRTCCSHLSFVYALELFIYVCKYTLFGCVCMFECVSFFWPVCFVLFPARPLNCSTRRSRIFCLSTSASLSASGSLSGCRMVSEYVEWLVACLPANWVLLLSVVVILVTFQWALRFALFIAAVLFVFWFSVFLFHIHLLLLFLFLFSFYFWLLPSCDRIYKCIWMVSACLSALFFPHFGWFYLIFMAFYIRIFARAFFVSEWFGAYESRTGCVWGSLWSTEGFIGWIFMYKQGNMTMIL